MSRRSKEFRRVALELHQQVWYVVVLSLLALLSAGLLVFEVSTHIPLEEVELIHSIDVVIALIFLADFLLGLYGAPDRKKYLKRNWIFLLGAIPITTDMYRSLRVVRLIRLARLVPVAARLWLVGRYAEIVSRTTRWLIYLTSIVLVILLAGSLALYTVEAGLNPQIASYIDALHWAVATVAGVGSSEVNPVTTAGKTISIALMLIGVAIFVMMVGLVSRTVLHLHGPSAPDEEAKHAATHRKTKETTVRLRTAKRATANKRRARGV